MFKVSDTHFAATWLLHPEAPKFELPDAVKRLKENRGSVK
jgi:oligopeptide transport system ATP-binding protein